MAVNHTFSSCLRLSAHCLLVALAFFITGKLSTFLAVPPGYATAIWPPSGIALASILILGYRIWPGIMLGSMLVNMHTLLAASAVASPSALQIVVAISLGSTLQALVGAYLVYRFGDYPNALSKEKEVFKFFFLGAVSALVSATISVSCLLFWQQVPLANALSNWQTWWIGDTLGIIIFTPLLLAWHFRSHAGWKGRQWVITLPIAAMFVLSTLAVYFESEHENQRIANEFTQRATELSAALNKSITVQLNALRALSSFYLASEQVTRAEFNAFVTHLWGENFQGMQALEWSPVIAGSKRRAFEQHIRALGFPQFQITERDGNGQLTRAQQREDYIPITYVEPYQGNEPALGYDVQSNALRREALERARDTGALAVTYRIRLIQEKGDQFGMLAFLPLYQPDQVLSTPEQRRQHLKGYVIAVFRGGDIVTSALKDLNLKGLVYRLLDEEAPAAEQLIYSSAQVLQPLSLQPEQGLFARNFNMHHAAMIPVGGHQWRFEILPTQEYLADHRSSNTGLMLVLGLILTAMVAVFVLVSSGRGNMLQQLVAERTAAFKRSEERFRSTFEAAPIGVANVSLDGYFLEVNAGYCEFLGYSRAELLTMTCQQVTVPTYQALDAAMIAKTLAGAQASFNHEKQFLRKNGTPVWGHLLLKLVRNAKQEPDHFITVVENIDRRKRAEASVEKLLLAVEQNPNSVVITDLNGTIEYVNQAFSAISGYRSDELIGQNPRLLHSDKTLAATYVHMWATLSNGDIWKGEMINQRKDGTEFTESLVVSPVRQADGSISHYVGIKEDITERKAAEYRLLESEKRFRIVADAAPVLIWMSNVDQQSTWFNKVWLDFVGVSLAQALAQDWGAQLHPEDQLRCRAYYAEHFERRAAFHMEYRLRHHSGEYRWLEDHGVPIFNENKLFAGYIGSCVDIHERKITQFERERLLRIIEESSDFIATADMHANITFLNPAGARMVGLAANVNCTQLQIKDMHPAWATQLVLEDGIPTSLRQGYWQRENALLHADGHEIPVSQLLLLHRDDAGHPVLFSTIMRDISDYKRTEQSLTEAKKQAENLARIKTEFLANMSHEIRTPMNAIIGLSQLALNTHLNAQQYDYLDKILSSSQHLLGVLNDILDFSKLEAEQLTLHPAEFDMAELVHNLDNLFLVRAQEKALQFSCELSSDVPRYLIGDALRLQQVLVNLLSNSIKFTERGYVRCTVAVVSPSCNNRIVLGFTIADSGIGISTAQQSLLFRPFTQADGSITRRFGGTGLGLVISRKLVNKMGSDILCSSQLGAGSQFYFQLAFALAKAPNAIEPMTAAKPVTSEQIKLCAAGLVNLRVLLVEDNQINQQIAREFLRKADLKVVTANDGQEALDLMAQHAFDVVLMDVQMPVMDGLEATRYLRQQARFATLPIIAMSAGVTADERQQCLDAGMTDFIAKPIAPLLMIEKIAAAVQGITATTSVLPEDNPAATDSLLALPGFDQQRWQLLQSMLGSGSKVLDSVKILVETYRAIVDEVQVWLEQGERTTAIEKLHGLKGAAANLGAATLAASADALGKALKRQQDVAAEQQAFSAAWQTIVASIDALPSTQNLWHTALEYTLTDENLLDLQHCLEESMLVPIELLELLSATVAARQAEAVARLKVALSNYDYPKSLLLVQELQAINRQFALSEEKRGE